MGPMAVPHDGARESGNSEVIRRGESIEITNEFAQVRVCKIWTRNGERLEIEAPKLGYRIWLDPLELESISWQTPETFSRLLQTPFGPDRS
jgi:hypothetical protein